MGTLLPSTETLDHDVGLGLLAPPGDLCLWDVPPDSYLPQVGVGVGAFL